MFWKIYTWIIITLSIIGLGIVLLKVNTWNLADLIEFIGTIITVIGLYAYVYKKQFFTPKFWQFAFYISLITIIVSFTYEFTSLNSFLPLPEFLQSHTITNKAELVISTILSIPVYIAFYRLSIKKK